MGKRTISKPISKFIFFLGLLCITLGLVMTLGGFLTPLPRILKPLGIILITISIVITYKAYNNRLIEKSDVIDEFNSSECNIEHVHDFEVKLRKIERLKTEGLISEDEFNQKRSEIMKMDW